MHAFLGYAESPTVLQAVAYIGFLAIAGGLFARMTRLGPRKVASRA